MQDLNNDIEDIFRRASDAYPLKDGEDRWEEISRKLDNNADTGPGRNLLWKQAAIVLLLTVAFLAVNDGRIKKSFKALSTVSQTKPLTNKNEIVGDHSNINVDVKMGQQNNRTDIPVIIANYKNGKISMVNNLPVDKENILSVVQHPSGKPSLDKTSHDTLTTGSENNISETEKLLEKHEGIVETGKITPDQANNITAPKPQKPARQQKNSGLFYGISGGFNTSEVKSGGFSKPALQAGAIVGYRINKKVSVETSLILSKRNYKSAGEYFNMKNMQASMPVGMNIMSLTGNNTFLEIPLQVSYHVKLDSRKNLYIKSGASSYIIRSENNQYKTMLNGVEGSMEGSYHENKFYPAATLNVAVGLQKKISTSIGISVEPFIQLPLKGMGVGELPFKNAGLRLILFHQN
ncbi:MAG: outer membrane beta-barrel protein [Ferruginibacter sp.]